MTYESLTEAIQDIVSKDRHEMDQPWFSASDVGVYIDGGLALDDFRKIADAIDDLKKRGRL